MASFSDDDESKKRKEAATGSSEKNNVSKKQRQQGSSSSSEPFPVKLYNVVDDETTDSIISWGSKYKSFVILDRSKFERDLLPKVSSNNDKPMLFNSFISRLTLYGFKYVKNAKGTEYEYQNEKFIKGRTDLLDSITRKQWNKRQNKNNEEGHAADDLQEEKNEKGQSKNNEEGYDADLQEEKNGKGQKNKNEEGDDHLEQVEEKNGKGQKNKNEEVDDADLLEELMNLAPIEELGELPDL